MHDRLIFSVGSLACAAMVKVSEDWRHAGSAREEAVGKSQIMGNGTMRKITSNMRKITMATPEDVKIFHVRAVSTSKRGWVRCGATVAVVWNGNLRHVGFAFPKPRVKRIGKRFDVHLTWSRRIGRAIALGRAMHEFHVALGLKSRRAKGSPQMFTFDVSGSPKIPYRTPGHWRASCCPAETLQSNLWLWLSNDDIVKFHRGDIILGRDHSHGSDSNSQGSEM